MVETIEALFPGGRGQDVVPEGGSTASPRGSQNEQGGMAVFLEEPTTESLKDVLDRMVEVYDLEFEAGKALRYIHKIHEGRHVYFLAHLGERPMITWVELRGTLRPELWSPHTGDISKANYVHERRQAVNVTKVKIELLPTKSVFVNALEEG